MRIYALTLWIFMGLSALPEPRTGEEGQTSVQGKLQISGGKAVVLPGEGKSIPLVSKDPDIAATLGDERISGRQAKLLGRMSRDGSFSVEQLYIVRGEAIYRLVYFCATCNITTFAPGDCACCRQPTVPTEVIPTDPRIYHEETTGPPP
ncbi:MAG: hypothetical protein HXY20_13190 [Acidobacteria bacterium]|nr:hypothetical protein [Acidobacteriota bacterium]